MSYGPSTYINERPPREYSENTTIHQAIARPSSPAAKYRLACHNKGIEFFARLRSAETILFGYDPSQKRRDRKKRQATRRASRVAHGWQARGNFTYSFNQ